MQLARRLFIGGNWKSNMTYQGAFELIDSTLSKMEHKPEQIDVVVFPNYLHTLGVRDSLVNTNVQVNL